MSLPRLLLLTDRTQLPPGRDLLDTVSRCVAAGLEAVVVRELDLPQSDREVLLAGVGETGVTVIAARTWSTYAQGVHLSSTQPASTAAPAAFHGRSCHTPDEVRAAVAEGAAYVTVSPVAASRSKPGYGPTLRAEGVRRAADAAGAVPVFALGGVDANNAAALRQAGAYGVAVMGEVMRAQDPARVLTRILDGLG